jgi:hypothetical protein
MEPAHVGDAVLAGLRGSATFRLIIASDRGI